MESVGNVINGSGIVQAGLKLHYCKRLDTGLRKFILKIFPVQENAAFPTFQRSQLPEPCSMSLLV